MNIRLLRELRVGVRRDFFQIACHDRPFYVTLIRATLVAVLMSFTAVSSSAQQVVDFTRDIKPLLSDRCFHCHGPDENRREADLRLDIREWAVEYAIDPGNPDGSPLLDRLMAEDEDERMPPAYSNKPPFTAEQTALFRQWVEQGAAYAPHWSYVAPKRSIPPSVTSDWGQNPIDQFILAGLESRGMSPAPRAEPRTLVRRLSFDLLGLPPSIEQVESFAAAPSETAYQTLIDQVFESPAYGERMAVFWLDLVRYADTNGIHGDNHRDHDLFRDYVINAFNDNMPFDQFTREQLAGDLFDEPTDWQLIASGYNRLNMTTREGGAQPKEYIAKYAADRVRNASAVWLGSTLGCAECHNHKYDPFTTRDFYSFAAFFSDVDEVAVGQQVPTRIATPEQKARAEQLRRELADAEQAYQSDTAELQAAMQAWVLAQQVVLNHARQAWRLPSDVRVDSEQGATYRQLKDQSWLAEGENPDHDTIQVEIVLPANQTLSAIRLETLTHPSLANQGLSRANGNFVLSEVELLWDGEPIPIERALADYSQRDWPINNTLDQNPNTGWAVDGHQQPSDHQAVFVLAKPIQADTEVKLQLRLIHQSAHAKHVIGRFRVTTASDQDIGLPQAQLSNELVEALDAEPAERSEEQLRVLDNAFRQHTPLLAAARQAMNEARDRLAKLESEYRPVLITQRRDPLMVRVLPRGNWLDESGEIVQPQGPSFLPPVEHETDRASRADLADWFVNRENPLVARVMVNRLWKICFGEGLVRTPDDFGSQGSVPTHPELLDWLAVEFIDSGWNVEHMLRLMVESETYRQSSYSNAEQRAQDPTNQWLSRQNRFRLDAEFVRDNALSICDLLVQEIGGPSVKPYQPPGYWAHLNFPTRKYQADQGANQYRRGLYTYWCRTFLHPSLLAFDAPSREECTVQRSRSNTPLQALVLLNDPTYVESARRLAELAVTSADDDQERLQLVYQRALQRMPSETEKAILNSLLQTHRQRYQAEPDSAEQLIQVGQVEALPAASDVAPSELAAWINVCRAVLNLHETITRY